MEGMRGRARPRTAWHSDIEKWVGRKLHHASQLTGHRDKWHTSMKTIAPASQGNRAWNMAQAWPEVPWGKAHLHCRAVRCKSSSQTAKEGRSQQLQHNHKSRKKKRSRHHYKPSKRDRQSSAEEVEPEHSSIRPTFGWKQPKKAFVFMTFCWLYSCLCLFSLEWNVMNVYPCRVWQDIYSTGGKCWSSASWNLGPLAMHVHCTQEQRHDTTQSRPEAEAWILSGYTTQSRPGAWVLSGYTTQSRPGARVLSGYTT